MALETVVRRESLPDPLYCVETHTAGMQVICRVIELRGRFEITREIYETSKEKPHWMKGVELFKTLAKRNYSKPTNSMANLYKTGSS